MLDVCLGRGVMYAVVRGTSFQSQPARLWRSLFVGLTPNFESSRTSFYFFNGIYILFIFSLLLFFIYFYLEANYNIVVVFALHWPESAMELHVLPIPIPPLPLPAPSHPSRSSQCTSPEHLSHASNLGWWSVSPLIVYLSQCCSLRTSYPRLLPQSPKVCSVHLCLFFCFAYRVIVTIFLNSIYMRWYTVLVFIFLAYFTLYNGLQFHPSH